MLVGAHNLAQMGCSLGHPWRPSWVCLPGLMQIRVQGILGEQSLGLVYLMLRGRMVKSLFLGMNRR
ncbi:7-cyano-7-deazaguanine synthase [Bienertia sinuspersici]